MRSSVRSMLPALAAAALLSAPAVARSQISVLSSTVEEKEATKGETYTGRIVISNKTPTAQTVRIYQTDYRFTAEGKSHFEDPGTTLRSNASWVTPQSQRVVVPPMSDVTVPYSVKVPVSDSLRGTYWSAIMVEGAESAPGAAAAGTAGQAQVGLGSIIRYAIQVATHIGSTGTRAVKFENPTAVRTADGGAALDLDVITSGDRAVKPKLSVELYDAQGVLKGKGKQDRGLLFPGSSLRQHFTFGNIPPGTYRAVVFADTGDERVQATQFTITY